MILAAARKVFAEHPYNAASIRMIAAQGGFYHGLIRYHFPSKAGIFEEVTKEACQALYLANRKWLNEISSFAPDKALATYLDRFIEFSQKNSYVFRIIVNNLSHDDPATLPGYQHLVKLLTDTRHDFENSFPQLFSSSDARRFLSCLNALLLHFIGARSIESQMLGLSCQDKLYHEWIKETLFFVFHPVLEKAVGRAAERLT